MFLVLLEVTTLTVPKVPLTLLLRHKVPLIKLEMLTISSNPRMICIIFETFWINIEEE